MDDKVIMVSQAKRDCNLRRAIIAHDGHVAVGLEGLLGTRKLLSNASGPSMVKSSLKMPSPRPERALDVDLLRFEMARCATMLKVVQDDDPGHPHQVMLISWFQVISGLVSQAAPRTSSHIGPHISQKKMYDIAIPQITLSEAHLEIYAVDL